MSKEKESSDNMSDDWFWKMLAIVGMVASVASLIISLLKQSKEPAVSKYRHLATSITVR